MRNPREGRAASRHRLTAYVLINLATLLWSGNIILGRAFHARIPPWSLAFVRASLASLLFIAVLWPGRGGHRRPTTREWKLLIGMAVCGVVLFQGLQYMALHYTTAINAGVINAAGPLLVLLLARLIIAEPVGPVQVIGAVVSLSGVFVIVSRGSLAVLLRAELNLGDLLVLVAVLLWGTYSVLGRLLLVRRNTFWVTGLSTILAVPVLLLPAASELRHAAPVFDVPLILCVLYIGAGPSFIAFLAWNEGVRRLGPGRAMIFYNTIPFHTAILSWVALGEAPGAAQWLGGGLVVAGCVLAIRSPAGAGEGRT